MASKMKVLARNPNPVKRSEKKRYIMSDTDTAVRYTFVDDFIHDRTALHWLAQKTYQIPRMLSQAFTGSNTQKVH
ncbi:hypothetical protein ACTXT7_007930 [Hymenolepis weldensis]